MSRRVIPHDIIATLYRHCPDRMLIWLDELLSTAGCLRRCDRCAATTSAETRCTACDAAEDAGSEPDPGVRDFYAAYRTRPEAVWLIPAGSRSDPSLRLGIAALGGGEVGRAYADNVWIYGVWRSGHLIRCGVDLMSGGFGRTHHEMVIVLAGSLTDDDTTPEPIRRRLAAWLDVQRIDPASPPRSRPTD